MRELCCAQGIFEKPSLIGIQEIETVVVTTPVIETGNDVDFDYAILDPVTSRSIIQSAGRVRRHRPVHGKHPSVFILGRSPIAMQGGTLAMPGVETRPVRETCVPKSEMLAKLEGRHFLDLAGQVNFGNIMAEPLILDSISFPLRDAEMQMRQQMISTDARDPLGRYLRRKNTRWNLMMTRSRKFRRSETREVLFFKIGDRPDGAVWYIELIDSPRCQRSHISDFCSSV